VGKRQDNLVRDPAWEIGGADLVWRRGISYRHVPEGQEAPDRCAVCPSPPPGGVRGVDLGLVNLATDSAGQRFTGAQVQTVRTRSHRRRQRLHTCGTRTAKRRIRRRGQREARFQKDPNHGLSKALIQKAVVARKALAREDLSGVRARTTLRRVNRYARHSWAFFQLRMYVASKAAWAGIPVVLVDPRDSSRTCPRSGYCSTANRTSQAVFACTTATIPCGFTGHADHVGAINIGRKAENQRAAVNRPMASLRWE
jgi:IS605 OrfB family transposase